MKTEELYEGFRKEEAEAYRSEAKRRWGNEFDASEKRLKSMEKSDFEALKQEGIDLVKKLATQMALPPGHSEVQQTVQAYFEHLCRFNPIDKERFLALGEMYVDDPRFTVYYEQHAAGLALFLREAIRIYCA